MIRHSRLVRVVAATFIAGALAAAAVAPAGADDSGDVEVLLDGLSSPKGLTFDGNKDAVVTQGAFGPPGPLLRYFLHGPNKGTTQDLTVRLGLNDVSYAKAKNSFWLLGNDGRLLRKPEGKFRVFVADLYAFAAANPDPYDQEGVPGESNPFSVAALPNGDALVTDAAANSLLRVTPQGNITIVARLASELVSGVPAEAVPTSVAIGPDGAYYVSELKGFPFEPGSSNIWRIPADTTGAVCSADPAVPAQNCTLAYDDLTSIGSIAISRYGTLLVFEYAEEGVGVFEEECELGACPPAVLLKIRGDRRTELARGQLYEPGSVDVSDGHIFVTDRVLSGGRFLEVDH